MDIETRVLELWQSFITGAIEIFAPILPLLTGLLNTFLDTVFMFVFGLPS